MQMWQHTIFGGTREVITAVLLDVQQVATQKDACNGWKIRASRVALVIQQHRQMASRRVGGWDVLP